MRGELRRERKARELREELQRAEHKFYYGTQLSEVDAEGYQKIDYKKREALQPEIDTIRAELKALGDS